MGLVRQILFTAHHLKIGLFPLAMVNHPFIDSQGSGTALLNVEEKNRKLCGLKVFSWVKEDLFKTGLG